MVLDGQNIQSIPLYPKQFQDRKLRRDWHTSMVRFDISPEDNFVEFEIENFPEGFNTWKTIIGVVPSNFPVIPGNWIGREVYGTGWGYIATVPSLNSPLTFKGTKVIKILLMEWRSIWRTFWIGRCNICDGVF